MNLSTAFFLQTFKGPVGRFKFVNSFIVRTLASKMGKGYYAVASGRNTGVYDSWAECESEVKGYSGARYKKFGSLTEAQDFISENQSNVQESRPIVQKSRFVSWKSKPEVPNQGASSYNSKRDYRNDSNDLPPAKRRRTVLIDINKERNGNFKVDSNGFVDVYTDGACSSNGRRGAVAGIGVWFGDNHELNVSSPLEGKPTNNRAEIQAVHEAVNKAKSAGIKKLRINTDSNFLISCMNQWMPAWKRNGWKTAKKEPVVHKEQLLELEASMKGIEVSWNHVRGHAGIHGNEMADKLAREGCTKK